METKAVHVEDVGPHDGEYNNLARLEEELICAIEEGSQAKETKTTWSSILGRQAVSKKNMPYYAPSIVEGKPIVHVNSSQFAHLQERYENLIIGGSDEDRKQVIEIGSLHIASQLFILTPWKLFVEPKFNDLKTISVWVVMKKFPMELWYDAGFGRVVSTIGTPLFVDKLTETMARTSYVRVCVETDTKCTYPDHATVVLDEKRTFKIPFEYNWKPQRCTRCDVFGHSEQNCPKRKLETKKKNGDKVCVQTGAIIVEEDEQVRGHEKQKEGGSLTG
ncbi:hypothetical protein FRX31_035002 [Thalictrum thalictroides]|uniref:Rna exonuclease n=1 Tax=Thalictrum thalictroides TaxID=46969 RepID=A0A7J6UT14_THATH|nr:hypothetical protein FRX31_035002 [Thalictrum thalictroides]